MAEANINSRLEAFCDGVFRTVAVFISLTWIVWLIVGINIETEGE